MATGRIESGRVDIRAPGSVPMQRVSVQGVEQIGARVEAQGASQLAEALDRMSGALFQDALVSRQKEGLQFAAQNPLTPEQIEAAKNGDLSTLNLGNNPVSVFQDAVRKARSLELSSRFEAEGRTELVKLLNQVEQGQASADQVQTKINTMVDGFGKSLAKIDAEAAYKFRATMATHGNAVLKSALDSELKRAQEQAAIRFEETFTTLNRLVEDAATTDPENFLAHADVYRATIRREAQKLNNSKLYSEYVVKGEAAIRNAQIQAVTKELLLDPSSTDTLGMLNSIKTGQAGRKSAMLQGLIARDFDAVAKIEANVITAVNHRNAVVREQREAEKRTAVMEFIPLYEKAVSLPEGSAQRKALAGQIAQIAQRQPDAVPLSVLKDLLEPNKEGNPAAEFNALAQIFDGRISTPDQIWNNAALTGKQKVSLLKIMTSEDRRDTVQRERIYSQLAGVPMIPGQVTVLDPKGEEFKRRQAVKAQGMAFQAEAAANGKVLSPAEEEAKLTEWLAKRRGTEEAKAAKASLEKLPSLPGNNWITAPITRDNITAIERLAGTDVNKQRTVKRARDLLKQAEGEQ